jgi:hypothetical protein
VPSNPFGEFFFKGKLVKFLHKSMLKQCRDLKSWYKISVAIKKPVQGSNKNKFVLRSIKGPGLEKNETTTRV